MRNRRNAVSLDERGASGCTFLGSLGTGVTMWSQLVVVSREGQRARRHRVVGLAGVASIYLNSLHTCGC